MTKTRRLIASGILVAAIAVDCRPAEAGGDDPVAAHDPRVRTNHDGIRALIAQATEQSPTFRALVETINASDGIVYVLSADCGHGVRACLTDVRAAGNRRFLTVRVDIRKADHDLMASIGHELRHVVEVLGDPGVRSRASLYFFYKREGFTGLTGTFETKAAVEAGDAVKAEVGKYNRRVRAN
jgi:hypothetical protein